MKDDRIFYAEHKLFELCRKKGDGRYSNQGLDAIIEITDAQSADLKILFYPITDAFVPIKEHSQNEIIDYDYTTGIVTYYQAINTVRSLINNNIRCRLETKITARPPYPVWLEVILDSLLIEINTSSHSTRS